MTIQQQTKTVSEDLLNILSSKDGLLIGYSLGEDGDIKSSQHAIIKELKLLPKEQLKALFDSEPIIFIHRISPKNTDYMDEYNAIKGEVIESEEFIQFNKTSRKWER